MAGVSDLLDLAPVYGVLSDRSRLTAFMYCCPPLVFNVSKFIGTQVFGAEVQSVLQRTLRQDSSFLFQRTDGRKKALECLTSQTEVGVLENATMGCFAAQVIILTILICVCMVVGIKFIMALTFSWFLSYRLTEKPRTMLKSSKQDKEAMNNGQDLARSGKRAGGRKNLYTVMLVTCYSEGENSIRTTMDSLANTSYSSKHKLMIVICDGIVRGHGNKLTTPDIVVNMLELAPGNDKPKPCSYLAIADGEKQHNMAKVVSNLYLDYNSPTMYRHRYGILTMGLMMVAFFAFVIIVRRPLRVQKEACPDLGSCQVRKSSGERCEQAWKPRKARLSTDPHVVFPTGPLRGSIYGAGL